MNKIAFQYMYISKSTILLKKIANKYSIAMANREGYSVLSESDIFQTIKSVPNVYMIQHSYNVELPPQDVINPWGPSITFQYKAQEPMGKWSPSGNTQLMKKIENMLESKFSEWVMHAVTKYLGDGEYTVTVTQKPENLTQPEPEEAPGEKFNWLTEWR